MDKEVFLNELATAIAKSKPKRLQKLQALEVKKRAIYQDCKSIVEGYSEALSSDVVKFEDSINEKYDFTVEIFRDKKRQ